MYFTLMYFPNAPRYCYFIELLYCTVLDYL